MQWPVVNTLCQDTKKHHNQKDGSKGTPKFDPYWKLQSVFLHGKFGVEIRIMSTNKDNSHSWVRNSHESNKFVMNLNNNEQEIPEVQLEEYAFKLDAKDFASRSKAKAKSAKTRTFGLFHKKPIGTRIWTDVEPRECSNSDYKVSKKLIHLLRHGSLPRDR